MVVQGFLLRLSRTALHQAAGCTGWHRIVLFTLLQLLTVPAKAWTLPFWLTQLRVGCESRLFLRLRFLCQMHLQQVAAADAHRTHVCFSAARSSSAGWFLRGPQAALSRQCFRRERSKWRDAPLEVQLRQLTAYCWQVGSPCRLYVRGAWLLTAL